MFIVTVKENSAISPSEILCMGSRLGYLENGYPHLIDENLSFVNDSVDVFDVESVPEGIEPTKYCYTPEKGFYENPNYIEPVGTEGSKQDVYQQGYEQALIDLAEITGGME